MDGKILVRVISVMLFFLGFWILLESTSWGLASANSYLRSNGGSMDSSRFTSMFESYCATYRLLGAVLLAVGLYQFLRSIGQKELHHV